MARQFNTHTHPEANHQPRHLAHLRIAEAKERQAAYDTLTPQQKLDLLDMRLGKGVGSTKQRARLTALLEGKNEHSQQT